MTFLLALYVGNGLLLALISMPLIARKVPPNQLYGFRVRRTLEDPRVWYDANAYAGRCLQRAGIAIAVACVALYLIPSINPIVFTYAGLLITTVALAVSVVASYRYLGRISPRSKP